MYYKKELESQRYRYKNRTYYFFNDIISIKNFDLNNNMQQYSYYCIGYVTIKDWKYGKIYCVNPLYLET